MTRAPLPPPLAVGEFSLVATVRDERSGHVVDACAIDSRGQQFACDHSGSVHIGSLPSGDLLLHVTSSGYAAKDLTVSVGGRPKTAVDILLARGGKLSGTVFAPTHRPIAGAVVETVHYALVAPRPAEVRATTDSAGKFILDGVPAGKVALRTAASGYAPNLTKEFDLGPEQERSGIEINLAAGGAIAGHVTTQDGKPVVAARVEAYSTSLRTVVGDDTTVADGSFRFDSLAEGVYTVSASTGQQTGIHSNTIVGDNDETNITIILGSDTVDGVVHDSTGAVVPGAQVVASSQFANGLVGQSTSTDGEGKFHLTGLSGAPYELKAHAEHRGAATVSGVSAGATVELSLEGQGRVTGTVIASGGHPADTFGVKLVPIGGASPASFSGRYRSLQSVSPDGTFRFDDVPIGKYRVVANVAGDSGEAETQVDPDKTSDVAVTMAIREERRPILRQIPGGVSYVEEEEEEAGFSAVVPNAPSPNPDQHEEFGGIGAGLRNASDGNVDITFVMEGGPAFLAGVQANDEIVAVDGSQIAGSGLAAVIQMIRGPAGTPVDLSIIRGGAGPFDTYVVRDRIVL